MKQPISKEHIYTNKVKILIFLHFFGGIFSGLLRRVEDHPSFNCNRAWDGPFASGPKRRAKKTLLTIEMRSHQKKTWVKGMQLLAFINYLKKGPLGHGHLTCEMINQNAGITDFCSVQLKLVMRRGASRVSNHDEDEQHQDDFSLLFWQPPDVKDGRNFRYTFFVKSQYS